MTDLDRARDAIRYVLNRAAHPLKGDGFKSWAECFAGFEVVDVSLTFDDIKKLGEALKDAPIDWSNARAETLGDLVTPKQLWIIRNLGREVGVSVETECDSLMKVPPIPIGQRCAFWPIRLRSRSPKRKEGPNADCVTHPHWQRVFQPSDSPLDKVTERIGVLCDQWNRRAKPCALSRRPSKTTRRARLTVSANR